MELFSFLMMVIQSLFYVLGVIAFAKYLWKK